MPGLSKTRLQSFLQCPKRLWIEVHRRELLPPVDAGTQASFDTGHAVGEIARRLYDPERTGILIDGSAGLADALRATQAALSGPGTAPLFEATFERDGLLVRLDVLQRSPEARVVEVKSSTGAKPEHAVDCAIQAWVLDASRVRPTTIALAHIDSGFTYAGDGDYGGLLRERDMRADIEPLLPEVPRWLDAAQATLAAPEPVAPIGSRCFAPYGCPLVAHCWPETDHPLTSLPGAGKRIDEYLSAGYRDIRDLPDALVRGTDARRAWQAALSGVPDRRPVPADDLARLGHPRYYLDFETVAPAIPRWAGTRPYEAVPFQWSLHSEPRPGQLQHAEYLHATADMPARAVAESLLAAVGDTGPVIMYTSYERRCLATLARFCPDLAGRLEAVSARLVDIHPLVKRAWYHPAMQGSWSIKAVLPTIAPDMDYAQLAGVQEGMGAVAAWEEMVGGQATAERCAEIRAQLLRYCGYDTLAMVRVVEFLESH